MERVNRENLLKRGFKESEYVENCFHPPRRKGKYSGAAAHLWNNLNVRYKSYSPGYGKGYGIGYYMEWDIEYIISPRLTNMEQINNIFYSLTGSYIW